MAYNYKSYSLEQLKAEEINVKEKLAQAKQDGKQKYIAVYERKLEVVRSFMIDSSQFQPKDIRILKDDPEHYFGILRISGVMAWGYRIHKETLKKHPEKEVLLLVLLGDKVELDTLRKNK